MALTSEISDEKAGKILDSLAETLGVEIEEHLNECVLKVPEHYGSGQVRLLSFAHGISILTITICLKRNLELIYNDGHIHPLKVILVKEGRIKHTFNSGDKVNNIGGFESVLIASTPENNHVFHLPKNKNIIFLSIQINRKEFEPKIEDFIPYMHKDLSKIFRDVNGIQEFYYKNFYTPESLNLIDDIFNHQEKDFLESVLVEGLTYQLITLQLKNFLVNIKSPQLEKSLATKSRLKLKEAVETIEGDIANYTTVKDLAKKLRINEKTLQSLFKQFYNCTVNTYVRNFRANQAKMLVETTDLSIAEIAYKLGLNSPSYLSKLFKLYYGCAPTGHRNKT